MNEVSIQYDGSTIPNFVRYEVHLSINGTIFTPDLPEIGSSAGGYLSFEAVNSYSLTHD
jgi:hypothetical protein